MITAIKKSYSYYKTNVFFMSGMIEVWGVDLIRSKKPVPDMMTRCRNII